MWIYSRTSAKSAAIISTTIHRQLGGSSRHLIRSTRTAKYFEIVCQHISTHACVSFLKRFAKFVLCIEILICKPKAIDAVNQRNWSLSIKLRLVYFVIAKKCKHYAKALTYSQNDSKIQGCLRCQYCKFFVYRKCWLRLRPAANLNPPIFYCFNFDLVNTFLATFVFNITSSLLKVISITLVQGGFTYQLIKAGLHWRFCPAFSLDVFTKDIYYFHSIGFSFFFSWYVGHLGRDGFKNRKFSIF